MKIVVVDSGRLPEGVEFPPLSAAKYGWEQYLALDAADIAERCWRTDIVVTLATPVSRAEIDKMIKLSLLVATGPACGRIDGEALLERGVEVLMFPELDYTDPDSAQACCEQISEAIDFYIERKREAL